MVGKIAGNFEKSSGNSMRTRRRVLIVPAPLVVARQLEDRDSSESVFYSLRQIIKQKFSKNREKFFKLIFIQRVSLKTIEEVPVPKL